MTEMCHALPWTLVSTNSFYPHNNPKVDTIIVPKVDTDEETKTQRKMFSILTKVTSQHFEAWIQTPAVTFISFVALGKLLTFAELFSFIQQISIECTLCVENCFQRRG